jgi:molybdenum cofactor cytidylyltransferase
MQSKIAALILAAGMSTRMGRPKQLLEVDGLYMLEKVIRLVLSANFTEVVAVIGCEAESIQQKITIQDTRFRWSVNPDFRSGQSTSLQMGLQSLEDDVEGVMVFLGDQPYISAGTVGLIFEEGLSILRKKAGSFVVQPTFQDMPAHPVFFVRPLRSVFFELQGDEGAKSILKKLGERVLIPVPDKDVIMDIDTPEDI